MAYDVENLMTDIETILKEHLSDKIMNLNIEKKDTIECLPIDDNAYFLQSLNSDQINYNPFVYYGVQSFDDEQNNDNYVIATGLTIWVIIAVDDTAKDVNIAKRLYRYGRALKEVFEEHFDSIPEGVKLSVQSQAPIDLSLWNDSFTHKAAGVTIKARMG